MSILSIIILSISFIDNNNIFSNVYYSYFNEQYIYLYIYVLSSFILTLLLFLIAFILSSKKVSFEKSSSYECGFEPFGSGHLIFNIQFFIVGILFMIFDLELAYIFP
jgi:NADH:ubiquinone oxidoreductase subunit 3 (subunit A)